jgi:predicted amidohydrolase
MILPTRRNGNAEFLDDLIARSCATKGGHLWINPSQWTLYVSWGRTISGYDLDAMKARVLAIGGAIIDVRPADPDQVLHLAFSGPMIAVGEDPRFILCDALSYESLEIIAARYRSAGADIHNIRDPQEAGDATLSLPA